MALTNQTLLERIAPYLPYGLKVYDYEMRQIYLCAGICFAENELLTHDNIDGSVERYSPYLLKPILRPISDLTKPCLEGGKFPFKDLKKEIGFDNWCEAYSNALDVLEDNAYSVRFSELTIRMPYEFVCYFLKHHFDVFGLIGCGHAIDINTLSDEI